MKLHTITIAATVPSRPTPPQSHHHRTHQTIQPPISHPPSPPHSLTDRAKHINVDGNVMKSQRVDIRKGSKLISVEPQSTSKLHLMREIRRLHLTPSIAAHDPKILVDQHITTC
ncbi:hypothetical protein CCUS01_05309 [Colletotrichum cuscutae]|uniref:Uncharacterized protein n=1 Tax=Colletotrichum cuscutae TaxID=1209917 RepID=A0AAI9V905_9PEZI|nr:hypothetical protein CCUS01_05309 [Colletotrichum cuscutae]